MQSNALRASLSRRFGDGSDNGVLRWLYRALLLATIAVVAFDYHDSQAQLKMAALPPGELTVPLPGGPGSGPPRHSDARLNGRMTFDLNGDGRLLASGTIVPGTARAFADEIRKHGAGIRTIVLQSPGGAVGDAIAMGRLIRARKFATEIEPGRYCASSCPLVFAGGVERRVGRNAAIGVHQVSALGNGMLNGADGMEGAQQITAACQKYLREMGIDLGVWIHAMETPRERLYYLRPAELLEFRLATEVDGGRRAAR